MMSYRLRVSFLLYFYLFWFSILSFIFFNVICFRTSLSVKQLVNDLKEVE